MLTDIWRSTYEMAKEKLYNISTVAMTAVNHIEDVCRAKEIGQSCICEFH